MEIPANVETIEAAAFKGCTNLTSVTFGRNSNLKIIKGGYDTINGISIADNAIQLMNAP